MHTHFDGKEEESKGADLAPPPNPDCMAIHSELGLSRVKDKLTSLGCEGVAWGFNGGFCEGTGGDGML
eukprot:2737199-Ditylum_brightwellii.AAC.1